MQHLDEGTIHAWLDGALDAEEAARVEQHAAECATCAAAVAEARGLIAGASRIITALDHTPGGVVPRSMPAGTSFAARRSRSLWNTLRLTPARAAAAAVVFLAAGTALVLQYKPNDRAAASLVRDQSAVPKAAPVPATPQPAPSVADSVSSERTAPSAQSARTARNAPVAIPPAAGVAGNRIASGRPARPQRALEGAETVTRAEVAAKKRAIAASPAPMMDSAARVAQESPRRDTLHEARRLDVSANAAAVPAPAPVATGAVGGAVAASRRAASAKALLAPARGAAAAPYVNLAGCYTVVADAAAGLPQRVSLDTARVVDREPVAQRAPLADAVMVNRFTVSDRSGTERLIIDSATWEPLANDGIRLTIGAPARSVELRAIAAGRVAFVGAMNVGDRSVPVALQRVDCPR